MRHKRAIPNRSLRVSDQIQRDLADLIRDLKDPRSRELITMIETGAQRGANIIRQLLTFSRGIEGERVSVQCRHLLKEMAEIARETFPRNITITERVPRNLRPVSADATQLHQVLMNLCVNARDAMAQLPPGQARRIHISAQPADDGVVLSVSDTGGGIPPAVLARMFQPFVTTKGPDKGTGLGLAMVYGFVTQSAGHIEVSSKPGHRGARARPPADPGSGVGPAGWSRWTPRPRPPR